jgi:predicted membrane protein DUF2306
MTIETMTSKAPGEFVSPPRRFSVPGTVYIGLALAFVLLALPTGLVALGEGVGGLPLPFNLHVVDQRLPGVFKLHMLASGAALVLIPLVVALRRDRRWHRPLGRITAIFVVLGALSSFPVAWESSSVAIARAGFAAQGAVWLGLVIAGVMAIRRKDMKRHAELMLAMAAVASGAIWVRLTTAVATAYALPFDPIYGCAAWAGWLVPWIVVSLAGTRLLARAPAQVANRPLASGI